MSIKNYTNCNLVFCVGSDWSAEFRFSSRITEYRNPHTVLPLSLTPLFRVVISHRGCLCLCSSSHSFPSPGFPRCQPSPSAGLLVPPPRSPDHPCSWPRCRSSLEQVLLLLHWHCLSTILRLQVLSYRQGRANQTWDSIPMLWYIHHLYLRPCRRETHPSIEEHHGSSDLHRRGPYRRLWWPPSADFLRMPGGAAGLAWDSKASSVVSNTAFSGDSGDNAVVSRRSSQRESSFEHQCRIAR